jgi:hypothetical protein
VATKLQPRQENLLSKAIADLQKDDKRLIGKVLEEIEGTDNVKVITNYLRKMDNGGINRGRLLVMIPIGELADRCEPYFILLRRTERTDTPTSKFERYKLFSHVQRNKPIEKDDYLINDSNYSAFKCAMVGEYSIDKETGKIIFERSLSDTQSGIHYEVYTPNAEIEDLIINSHIKQGEDSYFRVGELRLSENKSRVKGYEEVKTSVLVKHNDFIAKRTGIFGKTRLGKSNFAKVIAANMNGKCGQLIFDTENEYGDKSRQDDVCLADIITDSVIFGFSRNEKRKGKGNKSILYNFYRHPEVAHAVISNILKLKNKDKPTYIDAFLSVTIPSLKDIDECEELGDWSQRTMLERKVKIFWSMLDKAGFDYGDVVDSEHIPDLTRNHNVKKGILSPGFADDVRIAAYQFANRAQLPVIDTFEKLEFELQKVYDYWKDLPNIMREQPDEDIREAQKRIFDKEDVSLLEFLFAGSRRSGYKILKSSRKYHGVDGIGPHEVIELLAQKKTCIINFNDQESDVEVQKYYTQMITEEVYNNQREKFNRTDENPINILVYYEEAHTLFPKQDSWNKDGEQTVYTDIAKRGAKHGIGMVYITQSVTDIDEELIKQTENLFVHYMSDEDEAKALSKRNTNFKEHEYDITRAQSVGYGRMLTLSNRFVIPVQADEFDMKEEGREMINNKVAL